MLVTVECSNNLKEKLFKKNIPIQGSRFFTKGVWVIMPILLILLYN